MLVRGLQERAARALPAEHVEDLDGWWLRYVSGGDWWAGTVLPHGDRGDLERRVAGAEEFYAGHGTTRMYLQVERDNASALRLYERTGFGEVCAYHYRAAVSRPTRRPRPGSPAGRSTAEGSGP